MTASYFCRATLFALVATVLVAIGCQNSEQVVKNDLPADQQQTARQATGTTGEQREPSAESNRRESGPPVGAPEVNNSGSGRTEPPTTDPTAGTSSDESESRPESKEADNPEADRETESTDNADADMSEPGVSEPPKLPPMAEPTGKSGTDPGDNIPDIEGVDIDGEEFSLSDYAGKVTMLDFWGDW